MQDAISLAAVDSVRDERGWRFWLHEGHRDPVLDVEFMCEVYWRTDPTFEGRVTVPACSGCETVRARLERDVFWFLEGWTYVAALDRSLAATTD